MSKRNNTESSPFSMKLDKKKNVSVTKFNGMTFVDIREFYTDKNGEEKPGKKGIALSPDAWRVLVQNKDDISAALAAISDGPEKKMARVADPKDNAEKKEDLKVEESA